MVKTSTLLDNLQTKQKNISINSVEGVNSGNVQKSTFSNHILMMQLTYMICTFLLKTKLCIYYIISNILDGIVETLLLKCTSSNFNLSLPYF